MWIKSFSWLFVAHPLASTHALIRSKNDSGTFWTNVHLFWIMLYSHSCDCIPDSLSVSVSDDFWLASNVSAKNNLEYILKYMQRKSEQELYQRISSSWNYTKMVWFCMLKNWNHLAKWTNTMPIHFKQ